MSTKTRLETGFSEAQTEMREFRADVDARLDSLLALLFSAVGVPALLTIYNVN